MGFNTFDVIYQIFALAFLALPLIMIFYIYNLIRKMDRRAEERLQLDKVNMAVQQKQINELSSRLANIEKLLKEVE